MYDTFANLVGEVFNQLNEVIKKQKQAKSWKVERNDQEGIQFVFGNVQFRRTLMYDEHGNPRYPLDEWLGLRKRQRYSPLVEVKVAEMASKSDYRETEWVLKEWTAVDLSHNTVGNIVRRVGEAQAKFDEAMVKIRQGIANNTLREVYLASQKRSCRKQCEVRKTVRISQLLHQPTRPSIGVKQGSISLHTALSSAIGRLFKSI